MVRTIGIYSVLIFLVLFPVLQIAGHFIPLQEFYLYLSVIIGAKYFKRGLFATTYIFYFFALLFVILLTSIMSQSSINNHDIFILRNCLQGICAFFIFDRWLRNIGSAFDSERLTTILINCFVILSIPSFIVFAQKLNLFEMREIVIALYKPQFHFLGADQFSTFRYTSVFKDFFTFACYSIVLCSTLFYSSLQLKIEGKKRLFLYFLLLINYSAQFFVARTSVIIIPFMVLIILMLFPNSQLRGGMRRKLMIISFFVPTSIVGGILLFSSGLINSEWIQNGLFLLIPDSGIGDSSYQVMQKWNQDFFSYVMANPRILLHPFHSYNLTVTQNPSLYTDSFYAQEIYRYGIYGMLIYILFIYKLLRIAKKNSYVIGLIVLSFIVLNYKGGNVFLMHKNSYLYSFFFTVIIFIKRNLIQARQGHADETTVLDSTASLPRQ